MTAFSLLQNLSLINKKLTSSILNDLFNSIVSAENLNDPDFNRNLIPVQSNQPSGQNIGEIWFEVN